MTLCDYVSTVLIELLATALNGNVYLYLYLYRYRYRYNGTSVQLYNSYIMLMLDSHEYISKYTQSTVQYIIVILLPRTTTHYYTNEL